MRQKKKKPTKRIQATAQQHEQTTLTDVSNTTGHASSDTQTPHPVDQSSQMDGVVMRIESEVQATVSMATEDTQTPAIPRPLEDQESQVTAIDVVTTIAATMQTMDADVSSGDRTVQTENCANHSVITTSSEMSKVASENDGRGNIHV